MSVRASSGRVRLHLLEGEQRVDAGYEVTLPISVVLTCAAGAGRPEGPLNAVLMVRRADGVSMAERVPLRPAALVLGVAATLCGVRPGLRDYELSGPIVRER
jgi:hypothetical protein